MAFPPFETSASTGWRPSCFEPGLLRNRRDGLSLLVFGLTLTFKNLKFKNMNVRDLIPASESAAVLMRSLSHPQRLLVLCALVDAEKSVAELREELGIDQVPMSQQLMRLRSDGLVEARREGTTVYYSIVRPEVLTIVGALHAAFCAPAAAKRKRTQRNGRTKR
jgi:DNA-binding transcriptional ArsR family regulator